MKQFKAYISPKKNTLSLSLESVAALEAKLWERGVPPTTWPPFGDYNISSLEKSTKIALQILLSIIIMAQSLAKAANKTNLCTLSIVVQLSLSPPLSACYLWVVNNEAPLWATWICKWGVWLRESPRFPITVGPLTVAVVATVVMVVDLVSSLLRCRPLDIWTHGPRCDIAPHSSIMITQINLDISLWREKL